MPWRKETVSINSWSSLCSKQIQEKIKIKNDNNKRSHTLVRDLQRILIYTRRCRCQLRFVPSLCNYEYLTRVTETLGDRLDSVSKPITFPVFSFLPISFSMSYWTSLSLTYCGHYELVCRKVPDCVPNVCLLTK